MAPAHKTGDYTGAGHKRLRLVRSYRRHSRARECFLPASTFSEAHSLAGYNPGVGVCHRRLKAVTRSPKFAVLHIRRSHALATIFAPLTGTLLKAQGQFGDNPVSIATINAAITSIFFVRFLYRTRGRFPFMLGVAGRSCALWGQVEPRVHNLHFPATPRETPMSPASLLPPSANAVAIRLPSVATAGDFGRPLCVLEGRFHGTYDRRRPTATPEKRIRFPLSLPPESP